MLSNPHRRGNDFAAFAEVGYTSGGMLAMSEIRCAILPQRACIRLAGAEVVPFLNALLTRDVSRLAERRALHAGLLTPKGKLSFAFLLVAGEAGEILIDCDASQRDALMAKLAFYRLRADVAISPQERNVFALWGAGAEECLPSLPPLAFADPRLPSLGARLLFAGEARELLRHLPRGRLADAEEYRAHRMSLGVAEGAEELPMDGFFPWEACLDLLDGVSLDKGCFIGQEIVSRVFRKGRVSRRLLPLLFTDENSEDAKQGEHVRLNGRQIGSLHFRHGARGLALMQMDAVAGIADNAGRLRIAAADATLVAPEWLKEMT